MHDTNCLQQFIEIVSDFGIEQNQATGFAGAMNNNRMTSSRLLRARRGAGRRDVLPAFVTET
jgi:hypothetical protein